MESKYQQALSLYKQGDYEGAFNLLYVEVDQECLLLKEACKRLIADQYVYLIKEALECNEYAKARHLKETYLSKFGSDAVINAFQTPDEALSSALKEGIPSNNMQIDDLQKDVPKKRNNIYLYVLVGCAIIGCLSYAYLKIANKQKSDSEVSSVNVKTEKALVDKNSFDAGYYEGTMAGLPMSLYIGVDKNNCITGQYRNIKYGTVLSLSGSIEPTGSLNIEAGNGSEVISFYLSYNNGALDGYGTNGTNRLDVHVVKKGELLTNDDQYQLKSLTGKWNDKHTLYENDLLELKSLYDDKVFFYGQTLTAEKCIQLIKQIIEKYDTYSQELVSDVSFTILDDGLVKCDFTKQVVVNGKSKNYEAYLIFEKQDNRWCIQTESDKITDAYFERLRKNRK